jgi:hypothetical protein
MVQGQPYRTEKLKISGRPRRYLSLTCFFSYLGEQGFFDTAQGFPEAEQGFFGAQGFFPGVRPAGTAGLEITPEFLVPSKRGRPQ